MTKKTLNLEISDLEQTRENKPTVSLMPCPCGASGGGKMPDSVDLFEGKSLYDMYKDIYPEKAKEFEKSVADSIFGLFGAGGATVASPDDGGYDIDYGGTTNTGPSSGSGGGAK